ncbi:MAG: O-antigen ligase family protein [Nostocaceae cyanobacterium]|nr:O-antigen ligase family protein [Nostocaceae cyanobacterium]
MIFSLLPFLGAVSLSLGVLKTWRRHYRTMISRPVNWGLAVYSLLLIISTIFAHDPVLSLGGIPLLLPFFIVFAAQSELIQTTAQLRQLSWIIVSTSVQVIIFGLGQHFLGWGFHFQLLWILVDWEVEKGGNPLGRMSSTFLYANPLAAYLVIIFILSLGLWIETYQERHSSPVSLLPLIFLILLVSSSFAALILTDSRNAWGIALIACLAYALIQGWRLIVAGVMGVATIILSAAYAPAPVNQLLRNIVPAFFWARLTDQLYPDRPVATLRKTQWEFAWSLTQQRPWTGWGLRNFTPLYLAKTGVWLGHPHNLYLMLASETGIPATLLFCSLIGWVVFQGFRLLPHLGKDRLIFFSYLVAFLACAVFNTVDVTIFTLQVNMLVWLLLAGICGVVYSHKVIKD